MEMKAEKINVQLESQKILGQFGTTEMSSYRIQKLCEAYAKEQIEKDRERIRFNEGISDSLETIIKQTPIILD